MNVYEVMVKEKNREATSKRIVTASNIEEAIKAVVDGSVLDLEPVAVTRIAKNAILAPERPEQRSRKLVSNDSL